MATNLTIYAGTRQGSSIAQKAQIEEINAVMDRPPNTRGKTTTETPIHALLSGNRQLLDVGVVTAFDYGGCQRRNCPQRRKLLRCQHIAESMLALVA